MPILFQYHLRKTYPGFDKSLKFANLDDDSRLARSLSLGAFFSASEAWTEIILREEAKLVEKYGTMEELDREENGENVRTAE